MQDMEDALAAKTQAVEELSRELEEVRSAFGSEGVQQVNAFEFWVSFSNLKAVYMCIFFTAVFKFSFSFSSLYSVKS